MAERPKHQRQAGHYIGATLIAELMRLFFVALTISLTIIDGQSLLEVTLCLEAITADPTGDPENVMSNAGLR